MQPAHPEGGVCPEDQGRAHTGGTGVGNTAPVLSRRARGPLLLPDWPRSARVAQRRSVHALFPRWPGCTGQAWTTETTSSFRAFLIGPVTSNRGRLLPQNFSLPFSEQRRIKPPTGANWGAWGAEQRCRPKLSRPGPGTMAGTHACCGPMGTV